MDLFTLLSLAVQMLAFFFSLGLLSLLTVAIYRLTLHPLAQVPGPRAAAISNIWQACYVRDGRARELGKTLHKNYGPVVRVGPNEVWFNCGEAFKRIYSARSSYEKSNFYLATALNKPRLDWKLNAHFPDTLDFLSEFDIKRYKLQRRLSGPLYSASNLKKFDSAVEEVTKTVVSELNALDGAEVDLKEWMHIIAVECLGAVVLSWSPKYLKNRSDGDTSIQSYLGWRRKSVFGLFPTVTKMSFLSKTLSRVFSNLWGVTFKTPKNFKPFFTPVYQKTSKRIANALRDPDHKGVGKLLGNDLLGDLIRLHQERPDFQENYLRRLAVTNFGAGHETMCSALTAAMAMIGTHTEVLRKVVQEVRETAGSPAHGNASTQLPYTQASIKEAQRLYPVIGMSLSRRVPATGLVLDGRFYPAGTTVGCNPVALHLNVDLFGDDAGEYRPDRWLQDDNPRIVRAMERTNLTWGGGIRTCPGRHIAELVMHKVVSTLIKEFDLKITTLPEESEMPCYFMAMMTGVKARFLPAMKNGGCI